MIPILIQRSFLCLFMITVVMSAPMAQTSLSSIRLAQSQTPHYKSRLPGVLETERWNWTTEPWNGDNMPYHQARAAIDKVADVGQGLDGLLVKYRTHSQSHLDDPLAAFRWAYTAYRIMLTRNTTVTQHQALGGVEEALRQADSPHTYDYARIRFLTGEFYTSHREAVPIAEKLLKENNDDYQVAYCLASIYLNDYVHPKIAEALSICDHLRQVYPKKSSLYTLAGEAYVLWWYEDKKPSHAYGVIENYQRYLQLATPHDEFKPRAEGIIKEFKAKLKKG